MSHEMFIKKGDTWPPVRLKAFGRDFTGATVKFFMRKHDTGALIINGVAGDVMTPLAGGPSDATKYGVIEYKWVSGDTASLLGDYDAELVVTYVGGAIETFPNDRDLVIHVLEDVEP